MHKKKKLISSKSKRTKTASIKNLLRKKGSALVFTLLVLTAMFIIAIASFQSSIIDTRTSTDTEKSVSAFQAADSGIELVTKKIKDNPALSIAQVAGLCNGTVPEFVDTTSLPGKRITVKYFSGDDGDDQILNCADRVSEITAIKALGEYGGTIRAVQVSVGSAVLDCSAMTFANCGSECRYGGQNYKTVQIGTQCWFSDNLNIGTMLPNYMTAPSDPAPDLSDYTSIQKWCYGNNLYNNGSGGCKTGTAPGLGGLYTWAEMMGFGNSCQSLGCSAQIDSDGEHQGICPANWHIPSVADWDITINYLSSNSSYWCGSNNAYTAKSLASSTEWNSSSVTCAVGNNASSNNTTGFNMFPGGDRCVDECGPGFENIDAYANFWLANEGTASRGINRNLSMSNQNVTSHIHYKTTGLSVRCLMD